MVRCQFVLCSNVVLENHNAGNDLPRMNAQYWCSVLQLNPMRLSDETHDVLMDAASLSKGLDYVEEIPDSSSETSDNNDERRRRRMALRAKVMNTVILTMSKKGGYSHISKYLPIILDDCCVGSWELLLYCSC